MADEGAVINLPELKSLIREEIEKDEREEGKDELKRAIHDLSMENEKMITVNINLQARMAELVGKMSSLIDEVKDLVKILGQASEGSGGGDGNTEMSEGEEVEEGEEEGGEEGGNPDVMKQLANQNEQIINSMGNMEKYMKRMYRREVIDKIRKKTKEESEK